MSIFGGKIISETVKAVGDLYTTDKARIEAETNFESVMQQSVIGQQEINKTLAASLYFFNSGWQPLVGWSAGFLILLYWAPQLIVANWIWMNNALALGQVDTFPIKPDDIMNLVWLVFGFGGYSLIKHK